MVIILKYVLLGILIYVVIIPLVEQLTSIVIQWLEVIKGKLILQLAVLQDKVDKPQITKSTAIGFTLDESEEDYDTDD